MQVAPQMPTVVAPEKAMAALSSKLAGKWSLATAKVITEQTGREVTAESVANAAKVPCHVQGSLSLSPSTHHAHAATQGAIL